MSKINLSLDNEDHKGYWFLTWLGMVNHNNETGTQQMTVWFVEIASSELKTVNGKIGYDNRRALHHLPIPRTVNIGEFPLLTIGMIFDSQGQIVSFPQDYSNDFRTFNLTDVQSEKYNTQLRDSIKQGKLIPGKSKIFANFPFPYLANGCPCFTFEENDVTIILPKFEISRYFIFNTSKLSNKIFSGQINELFWIDDEERNLDPINKKFIVAKGTTQIEAETLAHIAFVDEAQYAINEILSSIRKGYDIRKDQIADPKIFFDTDFPFKGDCSIYTVGREVLYEKKKYFLVYEILDTNYQFPYKTVEYDYFEDNRSGENKNDPNLPLKNNNNTGTSFIPKDGESVVIDIEKSSVSNTTVLPVYINKTKINHFDIPGPDVKANKKLLQEDRYKGKMNEISKSFSSYSTGNGVGTDKGVGRANLLKRKPSDKSGADFLQSFFDLVEELQALFTTLYLRFNFKDATIGLKISYFPIDTKFKYPDISDHIEFCFYNPYEDTKLKRRLSVVQFEIKDIDDKSMFFYLIEIDPYGLGSNGLRTATVFHQDLSKIDVDSFPNKLTKLLRETVVYEGNFSGMHAAGVFSKLALNSERTNHINEETIKELAKKHVGKIISIIKKNGKIVPKKLEDYMES